MNRTNDPSEREPDLVELRELMTTLDREVADAYGWTDLDLDHGFHDTRFGVRFTIGPAVRDEVIDRLLELNHARYAEEVRQGLHAAKRGGRKGSAAPAATLEQSSLFPT